MFPSDPLDLAFIHGKAILNLIFYLNNTYVRSLYGNTFKYHVFAPMGRFKLELIYLYFNILYYIIILLDGRTVENNGKLILYELRLKQLRTMTKRFRTKVNLIQP